MLAPVLRPAAVRCRGRMQSSMAQAFPAEAEMDTSYGKVAVPQHAAQGRMMVAGGTIPIQPFREHLRHEGQLLFPVPVLPPTATPDDVELFPDRSPAAIRISEWESEEFGAVREVQIAALATYFRMDQSFLYHPFLVPYMLEHMPSARLYPLITFTSSPKLAAYYKEVLHIPALHAEIDGGIAQRRVAVRKVSESTLGKLGGGMVDVPIEASFGGTTGVTSRPKEWVEILRVLGAHALVRRKLMPWTKVPITVPHKRGPLKGRGLGDVTGRRHTAGDISGVDMTEHGAKCPADSHLVLRAQKSYLRLWGAEDKVTGFTNFEGSSFMSFSGTDTVQLLPQRVLIPLHASDQKSGELKRAFAEAEALLEGRKELMEYPDDYRPPMTPLDISRVDKGGAIWKLF
eukprot:Sspe_Gene.3080::Locus_1014_Transcript_1_1_Confidence_1.000_Length_1308::g.3080::m.3080